MDPRVAIHSLPNVDDVALDILALVMRHRRVATDSASCGQPPCSACFAPHLERARRAIAREEAIVFVLPAFPAKSPNLAKVLGPLPDMAEQCCLEMLDGLCRRIRRYYAPGARILLCSDGRVFSDVVGMRELDVTAYHAELRRMIARLPGRSLDTFDLEDVYPGVSFADMRTQLIERHGTSIADLKADVLRGGEPERLYCGITRFLVEDAMRPGLTMSRTALQKDCRRRAYEVIQRSKAWGDLLSTCFPDAIRLSIHPQSCGSEKLGIGFIPATGPWLTPWHAVAIDIGGGRFVLKHRAEAEAMGAHLIERDGRPSHYVMPNAAEAVNAL